MAIAASAVKSARSHLILMLSLSLADWLRILCAKLVELDDVRLEIESAPGAELSIGVNSVRPRVFPKRAITKLMSDFAFRIPFEGITSEKFHVDIDARVDLMEEL